MDAITTEEREAIDAFMAQRSVTVVAPPAPKRRGRPPKNPDAVPIDERKARAAKRALAKLPGVRDRRRFKAGPIANGSYAKTAPADATGTIYPTRVSPVLEGEAVLKDGAHSSKIGGDVLVGRLRGAKIFTLTLEERATCPRSCRHWVGCYGNAMQAARRWQHGPELIDRLANEVAALCAEVTGQPAAAFHDPRRDAGAAEDVEIGVEPHDGAVVAVRLHYRGGARPIRRLPPGDTAE